MAEDKTPRADDETRRRFEEALARKQERSAAGNQHDPSHAFVPHSNTKRQRTFRRKSGG